MNQILNIVGNGFDLHHQIKSGYSDFGKYVREVDRDLYDTFEEYFSFDGNWSNLEETLAYIDADLLLENALDFLVPYSADDWSDAYHHDVQYEVDRIVRALSIDLKKRFAAWIAQLEIPTPHTFTGKLLNLDKMALYLTFNYTSTLQVLYGLPDQNILHIHNRSLSEESELVLGHAVKPISIKSRNDFKDIEDQDVRITEANSIIDSYFSDTYKPTDKVIEIHADFFRNLSEVNKINIMGHSLAEVDLPYLEEIVSNIDKTNVHWTISYYDKSSIPEFELVMRNLGIPTSLTTLIQISNF